MDDTKTLCAVGIDLHCSHEIDYIKEKGTPEIGDQVEVDPSFFGGKASKPKVGKVIAFPLDDLEIYRKAVLLEDPPSYATARIVHCAFINAP